MSSSFAALDQFDVRNLASAIAQNTGADGLIPVSTLGDEYFVHDDRLHALIGDRTGQRWRLGTSVTVKLVEATPITGGLLFEMISEPEAADPNAPRPRMGVRGRGGPGGGGGRNTSPKGRGRGEKRGRA